MNAVASLAPRIARPAHVRGLGLAIAASALCAASFAAQTTVELLPSQDNTLYQSNTGHLSNGSGWHMFAGLTATDMKRRALLRFDVAAVVPAGATILSAELRLYMSKSSLTLPKDVKLHRLLASWGEGASDAIEEEGVGAFAAPGDATWLHRFHSSSLWAQAGGDYEPAPSAVTPVGGVAFYTFGPSPGLAADVQLWLDQPELDFGWLVIGDEVPGSGQTTRRFDTRQNPVVAQRPRLVLTYELADPCGRALPSSELVRAGTPPNALALLAGQSSGPVLGASWDPRVDHTSFAPNALIDLLALGAVPANLPASFGTLLLDPLAPLSWFSRPAGVAFSLPVPNDCAFAGLALSAQAVAVEANGAFALTNALDLVVGTR